MPDNNTKQSIWFRLHIDLPLLIGLTALMLLGLAVLYSASGENDQQVVRQLVRLGVACVGMFIFAQIPPMVYRRWTVVVFVVGILLLIAVLVAGHTGKGAQRWLDLGVIKFQPSELMKLAVPMMMSWYLSQYHIPSKFKHIVIGFILVAIPTILIARQPDLGTSILIASSGFFALFLSGISWGILLFLAAMAPVVLWVLWTFFMHTYQKQRVLTFLDPETDPLGSGYHIIQSKIAIGSGGVQGKGWLHGTQSQLEFIPERHTDFIFSVFSEEFGLVGIVVLLSIYLFIVARGLYIAVRAQDTFGKLLAGSITMTFFVYVFVNIGMVSGLLPVVGVPLPLVSYGGTSMVTLMLGFGVLMSISTHRRLLAQQ
ncbi:MAG: rod shape determining protein RodA [Alteromonadaceae bacterium]|jgi:rod shape determining protein RodA